jgi:hypothetical protein
MKIKDPTHFGPYQWPQSGRPMQPYQLDPVTITKYYMAPRPKDHVDAATMPYLDGPIHTDVLRLKPGDSDSFIAFAARFGLHEIHTWAGLAAAKPWVTPGAFHRLVSLLERYSDGHRHYTAEELAEAWLSIPEDAVDHQAQSLREAFSYAETHSDDPIRAARGVLSKGWETEAFQIDLAIHETDDMAVIYERPQHIWSRAWFELLDGLQGERLPRICAHCDEYYVPQRRNKKYCSPECGTKAYDRRRSRDPNRREAQAARYIKRKEAAQAAPESLQELHGGDL